MNILSDKENFKIYLSNMHYIATTNFVNLELKKKIMKLEKER